MGIGRQICFQSTLQYIILISSLNYLDKMEVVLVILILWLRKLSFREFRCFLLNYTRRICIKFKVPIAMSSFKNEGSVVTGSLLSYVFHEQRKTCVSSEIEEEIPVHVG